MSILESVSAVKLLTPSILRISEVNSVKKLICRVCLGERSVALARAVQSSLWSDHDLVVPLDQVDFGEDLALEEVLV